MCVLCRCVAVTSVGTSTAGSSSVFDPAWLLLLQSLLLLLLLLQACAVTSSAVKCAALTLISLLGSDCDRERIEYGLNLRVLVSCKCTCVTSKVHADMNSYMFLVHLSFGGVPVHIMNLNI